MRKIILFGCLLLLTTGCEKKETYAPRKYPVRVAMTTVEDVPQIIRGVGQLIPAIEIDFKPQVTGVLTNVLIRDGQRVNEGDLLMTIDPRVYEAAIQQATAQLNDSQARLRYASDFASTYGTLVGRDYVSRLDYQQAVQNVDVYKAAIEQARASIKRAEVDLGFTQLRAPFKGYVGLRRYDPGNYVIGGADQVLLSLKKVTPISVRFSLPATYLTEIRENQRKLPLFLEAELPGDPDNPLKGTLWFIDNTVDANTGMIALEGNLPNEDERGWPGQFVRVYLRLKTLEDAVLVPRQAVVFGEVGNFVYVLDEAKMQVKLRTIGRGFAYKNSFVALWGLKGDEKVVIDGQLNLTDNAPVYIPEDSKKEP